MPDGDYLTWDKDDDVALDFVTACANVRMRCFGMEAKSQFEVKSMAGNIIPAIATTNAVIAGFIVLQALKILRYFYIAYYVTNYIITAYREFEILSEN